MSKQITIVAAVHEAATQLIQAEADGNSNPERPRSATCKHLLGEGGDGPNMKQVVRLVESRVDAAFGSEDVDLEHLATLAIRDFIFNFRAGNTTSPDGRANSLSKQEKNPMSATPEQQAIEPQDSHDVKFIREYRDAKAKGAQLSVTEAEYVRTRRIDEGIETLDAGDAPEVPATHDNWLASELGTPADIT